MAVPVYPPAPGSLARDVEKLIVTTGAWPSVVDVHRQEPCPFEPLVEGALTFHAWPSV